jgi:RNA polymerase sigma-70 factor (ECF subfamily)
MTSTPTEAQDIQDMESLAAGHDAGLDNLMERYGHRLFRYLLRLVGDENEAEEIAQDTFVKVYQNRAKFDSRHRFSSWVYMIATNSARDQLRRRQRRRELPSAATDADSDETPSSNSHDPALDPRESLEARETGDIVRSAIHSLPGELRIPVILSEYDGLAHRDIARILGCTVKAVEMRLYRAREALRDMLPPLLAGNHRQVVEEPG